MKTIRYIITLVAFALLGVIASAEEAKSTEPVKQAVSDEFMRFALDKAKQYTGTAEQVVGKTVDLVQKEAPETVEQFLKWRFVRAVLGIGIPLSIFLLASITTGILFRVSKNTWEGGPCLTNIAAIVGVVITLFSLIGSLASMDNVFEAIQIHVAPRIYLIEELGKLLK
jgi:ABC-type multidrug transport system fused ATPase/permease subunit